MTIAGFSATVVRPMAADDGRATAVTLRQYAGVLAGSAEGLALDLVLRNERIDLDAWTDAESAWADVLADDLDAEGDLHDRLDGEIAAARRRYARSVLPLDEDLRAWLDFVRRWSASDDPPALLATVGLRASDVLRIHTAWSARLELEPALQRAARAILERPPGELPALTLGELRMVPPEPTTEDDLTLPPRPPPDEDDADVEVEQEADQGVPALFAPMPGDDRAPLADAREAPEARAPAPAARLPSPVATPLPVPGDHLASDLGTLQPSPPPPPPLSAVTSSFPPLPPIPAESPSMDRTGPLRATDAERPDLPFDRSGRVSPGAVAASLPAPSPLPPDPRGTTTADLGEAVRRAPLPFQASQASPPRRKNPLAETSVFQSPTVVAKPALPFVAPASREAAPVGSVTPKLPLTVEQHAALKAEIAVMPQQAAEIHARYGVTPQVVAEVDRYLSARFAHDALLHKSWQRVYELHRRSIVRR